jgi:hypothetical protein
MTEFLKSYRLKYLYIPIFFLILVIFRSWHRIKYPEIWVEDGMPVLYGYINHGFSDLFATVAGYYLVGPKLISYITWIISPTQYPLLSSLLSCLITTYVLWRISTAPLFLRGGILLAFFCVWIPTNAEVFGLPLYMGWWLQLLLLIAVFYKFNSGDWIERAAIVLVASLSSPVCLVVFPLFFIRFLISKLKNELYFAIYALLVASLQAYAIYSATSAVSGGLPYLNMDSLFLIVPKFFGALVVGNLYSKVDWILGACLFILSAYVLISLRRSWIIWFLAYLIGISVALSLARADINLLHPSLSGPRYFFYPYILLAWFIIHSIFVVNYAFVRWIYCLILMLMAINSIPVLNRSHDNLNYLNHIKSCSQFDSYVIPVHYDGDAEKVGNFSFTVTREQCKKLLSHDLLGLFSRDAPTIPYRILLPSQAGVEVSNVPDKTAIIGNEWLGEDYHSIAEKKKSIDGWFILGSFNKSDAESGKLTLHLKKGAQIWYRSEGRSKLQSINIIGESKFIYPLPMIRKWVILDFSSDLLPDEFQIEFIDGGAGWGEWSAVGLRER